MQHGDENILEQEKEQGQKKIKDIGSSKCLLSQSEEDYMMMSLHQEVVTAVQ